MALKRVNVASLPYTASDEQVMMVVDAVVVGVGVVMDVVGGACS